MKTTKTGDNFVIIHFIRCMYLDIHIKSVVCSLSHCQQMNKHSTTKREINREIESEKNKVKEQKKNEKRTDIHKCWVIRITKTATTNKNTHGASERSSESEKKWQHTSIDVFAPMKLFRLEFALCFGLSNVQHQTFGCYLHFSNVQLTPVEKFFNCNGQFKKSDWRN